MVAFELENVRIGASQCRVSDLKRLMKVSRGEAIS